MSNQMTEIMADGTNETGLHTGTEDSKEKDVYDTLAGRCIALVFKERKSRRRLKSMRERKDAAVGHESSEKEKSDSMKDPLSLKETLKKQDMYEEFLKSNSRCYWNPHLEESIRSIEFAGWLEPCCLLVRGRDIYLETIKSAWAKKILRAPPGYKLSSLGELHGVDMLVAPQNQFTPLLEALCIIISELNEDNTPATLHTIEEKLRRLYQGMHPPAEEIIFETLDSLIQQRKIFYTGSGYQIMTPTMLANPAIPPQLCDERLIREMKEKGIPSMYFPFMAAAAAMTPMKSTSCQTSGSLEDINEINGLDVHDSLLTETRLERSQSMRTPRMGTPQHSSSFERTTQLRHTMREDKNSPPSAKDQSFSSSPEESGPSPKDINLKTSQAHQDKNKGEKASLFTKLFGRNKKKSSESVSSQEVECVTFSAQFPPPEWSWYESEYDSPAKRVQKKETQDTPVTKDRATSNSTDKGQYQTKEELPVNSRMPADEKSHQKHRRRSRERAEQARLRRSMAARTFPDRRTSPLRHSFPGTMHTTPITAHTRSPVYEKLAGDDSDPNSSVQCTQPLLPQHDRHSQRRPYQPIPSHDSRPLLPYADEWEQDQTICDNEISIKYQGRLPKKDSVYAASRDSGVNCVGVTPGCVGRQQPVSVRQNVNSDATEGLTSPVVHVAEVHPLPKCNVAENPPALSNVKTKIHDQQSHRARRQLAMNHTPHRKEHQTNMAAPQSLHNSISHESIPASQISCSAKYPPANKMPSIQSDQDGAHSCSSRSSNSKSTVIENTAQWNLQQDQLGEDRQGDLQGYNDLSKSNNKSKHGSTESNGLRKSHAPGCEGPKMRQVVVRKKPYTEIQLVPDCSCEPKDSRRVKGDKSALQSVDTKKHRRRQVHHPLPHAPVHS